MRAGWPGSWTRPLAFLCPSPTLSARGKKACSMKRYSLFGTVNQLIFICPFVTLLYPCILPQGSRVLVKLLKNKKHVRVKSHQNINFFKYTLTHWDLMVPYGDIDLGQHWLRWWLASWWHQAITLTNADFLSIRSSGTNLSEILIKM